MTVEKTDPREVYEWTHEVIDENPEAFEHLAER
jgi:hypothetical protein